ncbi:MAG: ribonuclease G [Cellvibrionaceae bacterium]
MSEELLINHAPTETRVALVENGVLQEVYVERSKNRGIVGNIYKGKVVRVLPGMQAAFVDIGLERAGFIHAQDIAPLDENGMEKRENKVADIRNLAREGEPIVVQVVKDPIGTKGARLTTHLSVSSRNLVYMPQTDHIGVSQRIEGEAERERMKELMAKLSQNEEVQNMEGGFIVRTVAEGASEEELASDIPFLHRLWAALQRRMEKNQPPALIYEDLPLYLRTMRDIVRSSVEKIRVDSREAFAHLKEFSEEFCPDVVGCIEHYPGERPLFDLYSVEDEIQKALGNRVDLKSGGYLIIEQTEAMSTIDVNTGAFVGNRNLEETIFKTNLEAATAIARQLRLRNLGGIIILDFIDMREEEHRRQVLRTLEKAMEKDRVKITVTGVSELGLVEMTRKRTRESLGQMLTETCSVCQGRGAQKTPETVCYEIFREILREARAYDSSEILVLASQVVIDRLLDEESANVADLEEFIRRPIQFQVENLYHQEQYDIVLS